MSKFSRIIKLPFKLISSPVKFLYNKRTKLVQIISPTNVRIRSVKILTMGKRTLIIAVFIITIIKSSGMETQKITQKSYTFSQNTQIERVVEARGGAIEHVWSPRARYESKSKSMKETRAAEARANQPSSRNGRNLRRRLLAPDLNPALKQQKPRYKYKPSPLSMHDNTPKSGKGIRVRSIAKTNENGDIETIYYNKEENKSQVETKTVENKNSGLIKARKNPVKMEHDNLTPEGDLVNPSKLTSKDRRSSPLYQSRYENKDQEFFPAYSVDQLAKKDKHTPQILDTLNKDISKYRNLPIEEQLNVDITIVESLLAHPDTELYTNVMGQGREPISMVLNCGLGTYPVPNHVSTFERRPEICEYNAYITNYQAEPDQIANFDASKNSSITYEDLVGNSQINTGPVFGASKPTLSPTIDQISSDSSDEL